MRDLKWTRIGRTVSEDGVTVIYGAEGTDLQIESRKRHIPHANREGTWDHTTYFVLRDGAEIVEMYSLADAKEYAGRMME